MNTLIDIPEEDSPDLTLDEIAKAETVATPEGMGESLSRAWCQTCQHRVMPIRYQLRRRAPHYYVRVSLMCHDGHKGEALFRADFLKAPGG